MNLWRKILWGTAALLLVAGLVYSFYPAATPSEQEYFARTEPYRDHWEVGVYHCAKCGKPVFSSAAKVRREARWPVFSRPVPGAVHAERVAFQEGERVKVRCAHCQLHLGYLCDEGRISSLSDAKPVGEIEYCALSSALRFGAAPAPAAD